jgi:predicted phosphoribosyltransferase
MFTENPLKFRDRKDAGMQLGLMLKPKYEAANPLVLGIPRGGVEVAWYVADILKCGFSIVVAKKLAVPGNEEYGFGAVAEEHTSYVAPVGFELLSRELINEIIEEQYAEIDRRVRKYRNGKPLPDMKGRTVIIVDDGIATGSTLVPVLELCRKQGAEKVVIAAPVSGKNYDPRLKVADQVEVLLQPDFFSAVGQVYDHFDQVSDEQVIKFINQPPPSPH